MNSDDYLSIRATRRAWLDAVTPGSPGRGRPATQEAYDLKQMCLHCNVPENQCFGTCRNVREARAKQAGTAKTYTRRKEVIKK